MVASVHFHGILFHSKINAKWTKDNFQAQIGGHSVDMPVSNPYLTDKIIDEEMTPLLDTQINTNRKWFELSATGCNIM